MSDFLKHISSGKVGARLVVPYLITSGAIFLLVCGIIYFNFTTRSAATRDLQNKIAETAAQGVGDYLDSIVKELVLTSKNVSCDGCRPNTSTTLKNALENDPSIYELGVIDATGQETERVAKYGDTPATVRDMSQEDKFIKAFGGEQYISQPYTSPYGLPSVSMSVPIYNKDGERIGVLLAEVDLSPMWGRVVSVGFKESGYAYVVDATGRLIAYRDVAVVRKNILLTHVAGVKSSLEGSRAFSTYRSFTDQEVQGTGRQVESTGWGIVVELPTSEINRELWTLYMLMVISFVLLAISLFVPLRIIFAEILLPLRALREGVDALEKGNLNYRIAISTTNELGELADSFNAMTTRLRELYQGLEQKVASRTKELIEAQEHLEDKVRELARLKSGTTGDTNPMQ